MPLLWYQDSCILVTGNLKSTRLKSQDVWTKKKIGYENTGDGICAMPAKPEIGG